MGGNRMERSLSLPKPDDLPIVGWVFLGLIIAAAIVPTALVVWGV